MGSTVDLPTLPFVFTQLRPLTVDGFRTAAGARGVQLTEQRLEALHRLKILVPLLRVQRDGRAIAAAAREGDPYLWQVVGWEPTSTADLLNARTHGRLHDPAAERFISRRRLDRSIAGHPYRSSV